MAAFLQLGVPLPRLEGYAQHLFRLRDHDYILSRAHQEQLWLIKDWVVYPSVLNFVRQFVRVAGRLAIPVYCRKVTGGVVEMVHAQYEDRLGEMDWVILGQVGLEVVDAALARARWGAHEAPDPNPARWRVALDADEALPDRQADLAELRASIDRYLEAIYGSVEIPPGR